MINFIELRQKLESVQPDLMLADLPGYGYAKISKEISAEWPKFIEPYLSERQPLRLCIALVDTNVPPQASDYQLIEWLKHAGRDFLVVATKSDRLSGNKLRNALNLLKREHRVEEILPYSAENGAGKSELWKVIRESALTDDAKNKRD